MFDFDRFISKWKNLSGLLACILYLPFFPFNYTNVLVSKGIWTLNHLHVTIKQTKLNAIDMVKSTSLFFTKVQSGRILSRIALLVAAFHSNLLKYIGSSCHQNIFLIYQEMTESAT
ncbi:hypothetical protein THRCLA_22494 [Thraustotheca clavata]|uniref:Uncharacterized protein n=1 Tax=Thraustotheca clavata TaxID=74557 RepID=A0A1V9YZ33_9STRA|nr:hypothetical protein THRCLA_22494 [Thraustotheca clavata]